MDSEVSEIVETLTAETVKEENETKPNDYVKDKKNFKKDGSKKKDDRSAERVLKSLSNLESSEEKLVAMCKKYSEVIDENRKLQLALKQSEKKVIMIQREKEQVQAERSKAVLARSRLESLCRELQRQNKAVKDESLLRIREEEEKRKEFSSQLQNAFTEVTALMNQCKENNSAMEKCHATSVKTSKNFDIMCKQYDHSLRIIKQLNEQMILESQLHEAKLAKAKMEMTAEKEALLKEKQQLLLNLTEQQMQIGELQAMETSLRSELSIYTDKYDEFQNALTKSNSVFGGFKEEMEKMSSQILKLEMETRTWKQRWENSQTALLEMAADKQQRDAEFATTCKKLTQLKQLCRTLQNERTSLLAQLRETNTTTNQKCNEQTETRESTESPIKQQDVESKDEEQPQDKLTENDPLAEPAKQEEQEKDQQEEEITDSQNKTDDEEQHSNTRQAEIDTPTETVEDSLPIEHQEKSQISSENNEPTLPAETEVATQHECEEEAKHSSPKG
ncbi:beta-taxilin [Cephus cinctus]|uniref:Beta-taxilin n=1 Tax=Cephus cinctus TaxID=211228 RepID=A0AAJ7BGZ5_CEPCN|nr:beta-taxilin [Cephus cinctus]XP_024936386.1 beta-taxilin [Cephus cinctus]XP_024936387.1 beta-taxilin [Cephus cinctus]